MTGSVFVVDKPALNIQLAECGLGAPEAVEVRYSVFFYVPSFCPALVFPMHCPIKKLMRS